MCMYWYVPHHELAIATLPVLGCRSCLHWHPCLPYRESSSDKGCGSKEKTEEEGDERENSTMNSIWHDAVNTNLSKFQTIYGWNQ